MVLSFNILRRASTPLIASQNPQCWLGKLDDSVSNNNNTQPYILDLRILRRVFKSSRIVHSCEWYLAIVLVSRHGIPRDPTINIRIAKISFVLFPAPVFLWLSAQPTHRHP